MSLPKPQPDFGHRALRRCVASLLGGLLLAAPSLSGADLLPANGLGLRVARGFAVSLFANANLADDIYAMTLNPRGQVVVTGRGYIRTLIDTDNDGFADRSVEFGETVTGGMALCFDGDDLLFVGDGALWRVRDANGDNRADGDAEKLIDLPFAEHGGHAVRKGPDGAIYVMVGNETKLAGLSGPVGPTGSHPIEGGALLRLAPGGAGGFRVIAQGFRNAYDFDFNQDGDLFTYDSDAEADVLLPWFTPTRLFHIAPGGHHGWRLDGWKRSWARPDYSPDTVDILAKLGRGSPTGVTCYRHQQFPEYYREGLFALDWTFGRVYFATLAPDGASYSTQTEVFLESAGTTGFAPTDVAVGRDGSLFISTGGRRSRGGVYRVDYVAEPLLPVLATNWMRLAISEAHAVLNAPQSLEEWARRLWQPMAGREGAEPFASIASDNGASVQQRTRAIEILTELHGGLSPDEAAFCARAGSPLVRGRTAWSLSVQPTANVAAILAGLARDNSAYVRCAALHALREQVGQMTPLTLQQALAVNLGHPEKRVRQAAALLATWMPDAAWNALFGQMKTMPAPSRLTLILAALSRKPVTATDAPIAEATLDALGQSVTVQQRIDAVRLLIGSLGDYNLKTPSAEVFTGYEPAFPLQNAALAARIEKAISPLFPSTSADLNTEVTRLLAMIEAKDPALPHRVLSAIGPQTDPAADFHYLATIARFGATVPTNALDRLALAIVALDRKLEGQANRPKQNWTSRLNEVVQRLLDRHPALAPAIVRQPELVRSGNLPLVSVLGPNYRIACARLFQGAVLRTPGYPWSVELIDLLAALPEQEVHPLFRRQWANAALRERLILELAPSPVFGDRVHFIAGLESADARVVQASATALLKLPGDAAASIVATMRALRRFSIRPEDRETRARLLALINHVSGQSFSAREEGGNLAAAYDHVFDWVARFYPGALSQVDADDRESQAKWDAFYKSVPWNRGDASRGQAIYRNRGCVNCHEGSSAFGPDLAGAANRFSTTDLFNAILYPSREIAAPYRMEMFRLRNGESYLGRVSFESGEAIIVQTGISSTVRIEVSQIASREPSLVSFMPGGLLAGLTPAGFADLYAWLKSLQPVR